MSTNTKEFLDKINFLENSLDLNKLKYSDFNPWPLIRLSIHSKWADQQNHSTTSKNIIEQLWGKARAMYRSMFLYIKSRSKTKSADIVYFTRMDWFEQNIDNTLFNKHSDSFRSIFSHEYSIKFIELGPNQVSKKNTNLFNNEVVYINFLMQLERVRFNIWYFFNNYKNRVNNGKKIENLINKSVYNVFNFRVNNVDNELKALDLLANKFVKILNAYNAKIVFLECFQYQYGMAISLACHRLGINCIDYLHGAPHNYQWSYAKWENTPIGGYEIIPDIFWVWGKHSQKVINAWCIHTTKHQAIIGGNLFVMFMMNRNVARPMYIDSYYIKNKVNILVTLYGDEYLPEYLINSVERSPDAYNWHFRNHPTNHVSKKLAKRILTLKNTEIEFSSNSLLYDLLPEVDIHITGFSTTAFEAQSFGVPTIFTHINAKNGYGDIIGRNGMFYTDSQEYLDLLINKLSSSHEKIIPEYIDSNIETAYSALSKIINN